MKHLLTNSHISTNTRKRAVKTFVWSTLLYAAETWTISKTMEKRIEAMEMWCWRRVLKIPWTARRTNEQVLERMITKREIMKNIREKQMQFPCHVIRRDQLENLSVTGKIDGKRERGRQREKFMDRMIRTARGN